MHVIDVHQVGMERGTCLYKLTFLASPPSEALPVAAAQCVFVIDRHAPAFVDTRVSVRITHEACDVIGLQTAKVDESGRRGGLTTLREADVADDATEVVDEDDDRHGEALPVTTVRKRKSSHKHEPIEVDATEVKVTGVTLRLRNAIERQLRDVTTPSNLD